MTAYYNEHDPFAVAMLRELIADNLIAPGIVDDRSIEDVTPDDLRGFTQCHFFAGIGGWSLALRIAGVPDDRSLWTASCPCQPFSSAGEGGGFADERHLWPAFHYLVEQCRPDLLFGEQVASKDALEWVDLVHADLEATRYALGVSDLCAAGVGAAHIRQRLYWVAHAEHRRLRRRDTRTWHAGAGAALPSGAPRWLGDCNGGGLQPGHAGCEPYGLQRDAEPAFLASGNAGLVADDDDDRCARRAECDGDAARPGQQAPRRDDAGRRGIVLGRLADSSSSTGLPIGECEEFRGTWRRGEGGAVEQRRGAFWSDARWLICSDGKARAVEPGIFPLAHGFPNRVGLLRGAGNAISPPCAAEFIEAYFESYE